MELISPIPDISGLLWSGMTKNAPGASAFASFFYYYYLLYRHSSALISLVFQSCPVDLWGTYVQGAFPLSLFRFYHVTPVGFEPPTS